MADSTFLIFVLSVSILTSCESQDTNALLLKVVEALEKVAIFYKANYHFMNLDGIFGLKVVEGQVQLLLKEHEEGRHSHLSGTIIQRLQAIMESAALVGELAIESVRADDETYFKNLALVITKPWLVFKRHRRIEISKRWEIPVYHSNADVKFDEHQSDTCMMEMTLPDKNKLVNGSLCALSQNCVNIMTKRGFTDYGITHQVLFTALAEKVGCVKELNSLLQEAGFRDSDDMQLEFCTNNFYEMVAVVHIYMKGKIPSDYQDLFLEQQFVCPSMGFFEFLKKDYIDQILSWQMPSGCFGDEGKGGLQPTRQPLNVPPELDLNKLLVSHSSNVNLKFNSPDQKQSELNLNSSSLLQFVREKSKVIGNFKPGEHGHRFPAQQEINLNAAKPLQQPVANFNARVDDQRGLSMNHDIENKLPVPVKDPNNQNVQGALGRGIQGKQIQDNEVHERKLLEFEVQQVPGSRRLLAEKEMLGGCLAHKTGVACGALVMYLRYLIDPGPLDLFSPHNLFPGDNAHNVFENSYKKLSELSGKKHRQPYQSVPSENSPNHLPHDNVQDENIEEDAGDGNVDENDYDNNDDMYPETEGGIGQHIKRVVHFGANQENLNKEKEDEAYDKNANQDEEGEYVDEDEEGPDYIKRVKGEDVGGVAKVEADEHAGDDTEYTYYDDDDNTERGIVKKHKAQPPQEPGTKIRSHNRHKHNSQVLHTSIDEQSDTFSTKTIMFLLSLSSLVLIIFMYRFVKRRRFHTRRGFLKL